MDLIYHYTSGSHFPKIIESGVLKVSDWERRNNIEPPALWLSTNPEWEPTATKLIHEAGQTRQLSKAEQHLRFGLYRFVLEFRKSTLCSWRKYRFVSNTTDSVYRAMTEHGIRIGANPNEWFASFKNIALDECISCEKFDGESWLKYFR